MLDLEHPTPNRLTFYDNVVEVITPTWSPDSKRIAYAVQTGHAVVHVQSIETLRDTVLFASSGLFAAPLGWSPDGVLAVSCADTTGSFDMWRLPVNTALAASLYQATPEFEYGGPVSPDGQWLACATLDGGKWQLRIRAGRHRAASAHGG